MPAVHWPVTNEQYHADTTHDSPSSISLFLEDPAEYCRWLQGKRRSKQSESMRIGTIAHSLILEPEKQAFVIPPDEVLSEEGYRKGAAYTEWRKSLGPDTVILDKADADKARWMRDSFMRNKLAVELLHNSTGYEHPIRWTCRRGYNKKAMFDVLLGLDKEFADIKTTADVSNNAFLRSILKFGYHRQAAWYAEGLCEYVGECRNMHHIVLGNTYPHKCVVYRIPDELVSYGKRQVADALVQIEICKLGLTPWEPPPQTEPEEINIPGWLMREIEAFGTTDTEEEYDEYGTDQ